MPRRSFLFTSLSQARCFLLIAIGRYDMKDILGDVVASNTKTKVLLGLNTCSLHSEASSVISILSKPIVYQLTP